MINVSEKRLHMKHVTKAFPGVVALNDVSIELNRNEILSIIGENGAGKSTLMKVLSGTYPHDSYSGEIIVDGRPVQLKNAQDSEREGIAMIYQELNIQLDMTVEENIMLGCWPKYKSGLIDWKTIRKKAHDALAMLNVDLDTGLKMRNLNASLQQLVCIARALVRDPSILILDEPTAALTQEEAASLLSIIRNLKQGCISCIYISHKLDEVFDISDRVVVMRNGCVVSEYKKEEIEPGRIIQDMIGREVDQMYPKSTREFGEEVLRVEDLYVPHPYAPGKNLIDGVSFSVRKGEVLGLAGLVGSGRSELLRALYGALPKLSGDVYIEDQKCSIAQPRDAIAAGMFMVTEDRKSDGFVGTMSIKHNMTLSIFKKISKATFLNRHAENRIAQKFFDYLAIKAPGLDTNMMTLSGGNQQKVILSRALATDMKVLLLDEPTRGIDVGAKSEIYKIIDELAGQGMSIIVISSEMPELISICDRFVVLSNGKLVAQMLKSEVSETKLLHASALGAETTSKKIQSTK
ncbi:MAG: sugar ABC transporter ATP-binding protein [Christensenellales bacterium]|jgi:D-xylose transport system ATP-binding protein